jgi:hypothetical protein
MLRVLCLFYITFKEHNFLKWKEMCCQLLKWINLAQRQRVWFVLGRCVFRILVRDASNSDFCYFAWFREEGGGLGTEIGHDRFSLNFL